MLYSKLIYTFLPLFFFFYFFCIFQIEKSNTCMLCYVDNDHDDVDNLDANIFGFCGLVGCYCPTPLINTVIMWMTFEYAIIAALLCCSPYISNYIWNAKKYILCCKTIHTFNENPTKNNNTVYRNTCKCQCNILHNRALVL